MATLKEIAQLCNVSPSTVSNILNGKTNVSDQTRQKVMNTITKLEYQPNFFAQSMRKQNSHIIAIITEDLICLISSSGISSDISSLEFIIICYYFS